MEKLTKKQIYERAESKVKTINAALVQSAFTSVRSDLEKELQLAEFVLFCRDNEAESTRDNFILLCNKFWNWTEQDAICEGDEGYEPLMGFSGEKFDHRVTQALWVMYKAAPMNYPVIPASWLSIPKIPSLAHLNSIAMRLRHDFGLMTVDQKESMRAQARQMYEECSGQGFFTIKKEPVPEGWTGNASADLALTLLGRLDSSVEDDDRISQIEQIIRGLVRDE